MIFMKVIFTDGIKGEISKEASKNLYIQTRFSLEEWQALKAEMDRLNIISYEDPFLVETNRRLQNLQSGCDTFVCIEYVENQIAAH